VFSFNPKSVLMIGRDGSYYLAEEKLPLAYDEMQQGNMVVSMKHSHNNT
jgi:hypothetical protein